MSTTKITKADLIASLVERGHHRPALYRLTLEGLQALFDGPQTTAKAATGPVALLGDRLALPADEALPGDVWEGRKIVEVQAGPRWTYFRDNVDVWFLRVSTGQRVTVSRKAS